MHRLRHGDGTIEATMGPRFRRLGDNSSLGSRPAFTAVRSDRHESARQTPPLPPAGRGRGRGSEEAAQHCRYLPTLTFSKPKPCIGGFRPLNNAIEIGEGRFRLGTETWWHRYGVS